ncbi:hypothetical protein FLTE109939_07910 [Flavobacterium terrigena]|uniref:Uncharacterized protein n=1 Tax=Flavobacterium terrigena TaxID=402734 RepID=A0A1H6WSH3_9FLAO|nr:hypothetical protein SAMN05660918_2613 [Flavobacterium terrigena]
MRNFKLKIAKIADNLEKVTAKDLIHYSAVINRIQMKNRIFISYFKPITINENKVF